MTPNITIRSFSNDQYALDRIFYSNFYKLKGNKEQDNQPLIVDIGAHIGIFTFAALALGAKKIYCFEPFIENFKVLLKNIENSDKVVPYQLGVSLGAESKTYHFSTPDVVNGSYYDFLNINIDKINTTYFPLPCQTLDYILAEIVIEDKIDILKLNLGYGEIDILNNSSVISSNVENICIETTEEMPKIDKLIFNLKSKGFGDTFLQKNEEENSHLLIFSKTKCSERFNIS